MILVIILAAYGPASAVGFDFARSFNPTTRLGAASGIVNMGGFTASLITIFAIGVILDALAPDGQFDIDDFKIAFCFQYLPWAFGVRQPVAGATAGAGRNAGRGDDDRPAAACDRPALARLAGALSRCGGRQPLPSEN